MSDKYDEMATGIILDVIWIDGKVPDFPGSVRNRLAAALRSAAGEARREDAELAEMRTGPITGVHLPYEEKLHPHGDPMVILHAGAMEAEEQIAKAIRARIAAPSPAEPEAKAEGKP